MCIVLERGKADRVPVALISDADYQCHAAGYDFREFMHGDNETRAEIQRRFWLRHPGNDFLMCWSGVSRDTPNLRKITHDGDRFLVTDTKTGETQEVEKWKTAANPHRGPTSEGSSTPITCEADIERVLGQRPTVKEVLASGKFDPLRTLMDKLGDRAFVGLPAGGVFPGTVHHLGGFERAMEAVATNPSLVAAVVEELAWRNVQVIRAGAKFKPDVSWQSAYLEGADLISPRHWRELVLPGHRIMVEEAKRHGLKVLFWFLGDCMPLLEDIVRLGIDGLVVEQPRRGYCSDPCEVRRIVGKRICVYGWSPELAMVRGDRETIARTVERQIRVAGMDGAFVMGSTYLTCEVACETVDFFCDEVARVSRAAR
jgi:hypothetical protein